LRGGRRAGIGTPTNLEEAMKKVLLATLLVPAALALAAETTGAPPSDPMAAWVPRKVTNEAKSKKEIAALFQKMDAAGKKGDLDAAVALVDFPVLMATDDSKGEAKAEPWDREKWTDVMRPFYEHPMADVKVTHKPTIFLMSDSLATVDDVCTMTKGGKTVTMRNSTLLVRKEGEWRVKAMAEPGWGDMMAKHEGTASGASAPPSEGTGSGAAESAPEGKGTGVREPASPGGAQGGSERTTK
jgi:hypothetical protein